MPLLPVGFWCDTRARKSCAPPDLLDLRLPHPGMFIKPGWECERRALILNYLRNGAECCSYLGFAYCREECGVADSVLGSSELTDGTYVWPQGLAHYVEAHELALPEYFVEHMARHVFVPRQKFNACDVDSYDYEPWIAWAKARR
ncbi:MAG TPA: hypothetical protein VEK08_21515 [Planctomycetota bacterium]|nr:hypothetical protein [Planctomycetota bacterium]